MPLVILENASLAFGHHALLNHVDLQLDAGERIGLIGRNGSGKSSLLRVIAGEIKLDDGKLWYAPELKLVYVPTGGTHLCSFFLASFDTTANTVSGKD